MERFSKVMKPLLLISRKRIELMIIHSMDQMWKLKNGIIYLI